MATRNGKIAHLPFEIREQLNIRICNGEPGNKLAEWLNSLPAVTDIMNASFGGRPVSEQNLSEWRNGGYEQWAILNACLGETSALSESARLIRENGINSDDLLLVITSNYAAMIQRWNITPAEDLDRMMSVFQNLTNAVLSLRRAELQKVRVQFERERLELLREKQRNKSESKRSSPASTSSETAPASEPTHSGNNPEPAHPDSSPTQEHSPNPGDFPTTPPARPSPSAIHSHQKHGVHLPVSSDRPSAQSGGSLRASSPENPHGQV